MHEEEAMNIPANSELVESKRLVPDAESFRRMPKEYQDTVTHLMLVHTEGELSGADDYVQIFYPMAPNAYERLVCCKRAAEEMDHYMQGAAVLDEIGVDTSYMLRQEIRERRYYATEMVRDIRTWMERGLFSFLGEQVVSDHMVEFADCSYKPFAKIFPKLLKDERVHIGHGFRIVRDACRTDEGRAEAQAALDRLWSAVLDLFGRANSERSKLYLKWGMRKTGNEELRRAFSATMRPRLEALGLRVPPDHVNRKFV
jgi:ring-1,2-phenylacetyl-CoA epoxidase subunit PaaA